MKTRITSAAFAIYSVMVLCIAVGCMIPNYGSIIPDEAVTKSFSAFKLDAGMNYYYSGSDVYPDAIMGLNERYVLDSDLWKPIKATPIKSQADVFRDLVEGMQNRALEEKTYPHGFVIRDDKRQPIGVWYSRLEASTVVKMKSSNHVVIYTPEFIMNDGEMENEAVPGGERR
ncbi:MAG: hypothetical protein PHY31_02335 [Smithellaceae bacterium]|nr:hypothetical protein [Smithellaceae bacterium]